MLRKITWSGSGSITETERVSLTSPNMETGIDPKIIYMIMKEFDNLIAQAREQAHKAGLKRLDVNAAVARVRDRK